MNQIYSKIFFLYTAFFSRVEKYLEPLFALSIRCYIFKEFFSSGWASFNDFINGHWDSVVFLFEFEFKTPFPAVAAVISTFNELLFPVLILIGFLGRLSALVLLCMAIVIQLTYIDHLQHHLWIVMCSYIVLRGSGLFSVDYFIHKKFGK